MPRSRLHLAVAAHRIAAVVVAGRHLEHRHQVQIGDAQLAQIGDALAQALQVAREQVHVAHRAHHAVGLVPVRIGLAHGVQRLELRRPVEPHLRGRGEDALEVIEEIVVITVEAMQALEQAREMAPEPMGVGVPFDRLRSLPEPILYARKQPLQGNRALLFNPGPALGHRHLPSVIFSAVCPPPRVRSCSRRRVFRIRSNVPGLNRFPSAVRPSWTLRKGLVFFLAHYRVSSGLMRWRVSLSGFRRKHEDLSGKQR